MLSLNALLTAGLAALIPLTSAYVKPVGDHPEGNSISEPGLGSIVPVGKPFTVTWEPSTTGPVTLVLLKGPSSNAVPQFAIAEHVQNNGTYAWTPSADLAPSDANNPDKGYGIQLIDEKTGKFQYTTQFGISNANYKPGQAGSGYGSATTTSCSTTQTPGMPTGFPAPIAKNDTKPYPVANNTTSAIVLPTAPAPVPVAPTSMQTAPSPAPPVATKPASGPATNGATQMAASFGGLILAVGAAALVF